MAYPKDRNKTYRQIIELAHNRHIQSSKNEDHTTKYKSEFIEFVPVQTVPNNNEGLYPDPNGILTGSAFELAARGFLIPAVVTRAGLSDFSFKITSAGIALFEDKERLEKEFPVAEGNFAFVIMSFSENKTLQDCYDLAIKPVVTDCGFECIRVDEIEHNRRITDKVIECIVKAKFVIVDLTEQRPNCYYELGFAHALEKEVIHVIHSGEPIHFDVRDYNFIVYESLSELKRLLKSRIENTVISI